LSILSSELEHLFALIEKGVLWSIHPFSTAKKEHQIVRDISFSGDGEPTICPEFTDAVETLMQQRSKYGLEQVPVNVFSNATMFRRESVRKGLEILWKNKGRVWAKLDAGTEQWYRRVDASLVPFARVLSNIQWASKQAPIIRQCMFHAFGKEEPSEEEISAWAMQIDTLLEQGGEIEWIQVYTVARQPSQREVLPLSQDRLEKIAEAARRIVEKHGKDIRVTVS